MLIVVAIWSLYCAAVMSLQAQWVWQDWVVPNALAERDFHQVVGVYRWDTLLQKQSCTTEPSYIVSGWNTAL